MHTHVYANNVLISSTVHAYDPRDEGIEMRDNSAYGTCHLPTSTDETQYEDVKLSTEENKRISL